MCMCGLGNNVESETEAALIGVHRGTGKQRERSLLGSLAVLRSFCVDVHAFHLIGFICATDTPRQGAAALSMAVCDISHRTEVRVKR